MRIRASEHGDNAVLLGDYSGAGAVLGQALGKGNERRYSLVVKSTRFWSWTTLDFNFTSDSSYRILGKLT